MKKLTFLIVLFTVSQLASGQGLKSIFSDTTLFKKNLWKKERLSYYLNKEELHENDYARFYNRALNKMRDSLFAEAIVDFKKAINDDRYLTKNVPVLNKKKFSSDILYNIAACHLLLENSDSTIYYYQKIIETDPFYEDTYYGLASIYYTRGDYETMLAISQKGVDANPGSNDLLYQLGASFYIANQKSKAIEIHNSILEEDPNYSKSHLYLGMIYASHGDINKAKKYLLKTIELDQKQSYALYLLGISFFEEKDYSKAYNSLLKYNELDSTNPSALYFLGTLDLKFNNEIVGLSRIFKSAESEFKNETIKTTSSVSNRENYEILKLVNSNLLNQEEKLHAAAFYKENVWGNKNSTLNVLNKYSKKYPNSSLANRLKLLKLFSLARTTDYDRDKVINELNKQLNTNPNNPVPYFYKGTLLSFKGARGLSIEMFKKGLALQPDYAAPYLILGRLYALAHNYDSAIFCLDSAIYICPEFADAYLARGSIYEENYKNNLMAFNDYKRAIKAINLPPTHYLEHPATRQLFFKYIQTNIKISNYYIQTGAYDSALLIVNNLIRHYPEELSLIETRGLIYNHNGEYDRAINDFNRVIRQFKKEQFTNADLVNTYFERGNVYFNKSLYKEAIADYKKTLELSPNYASAMVTLADCYRNTGKCGKALKLYDDAIALFPGIKWYHFKKAFCYTDSKQYMEGIMCFHEATRIDTSFAEAYAHIGYNYLKLGKYSQCIGFSQEALKYDQTMYFAAYNIALALLKTGNYENAYKIYSNTKSVNDELENPNYDVCINDLKELLSDEQLKNEAKKILTKVFNVEM